jgi:glycosyltransferase involved in cell wall biosynthesis
MKSKKRKNFTLMWLNRICRMKNLKDAISAFYHVTQRIKDSHLIVAGKIGDGLYYSECRRYANNLGIIRKISFLGYIDEKEKNKLLSESHILLHTSVKEGWGLNILEANYQKTPSVVYRKAGLVDTVKHGHTGIICNNNTPINIAESAIRLFQNKSLYRKMQDNAEKWADSFSWEKAVHKSLKLISSI